MRLIGCVDTLNDAGISGWAADESDLDRQVFVDILVDSALVATVRASVFREDLRQAGVGDGCKGFRFDPGPYLKPGRNDVEVRYHGAGQPVPGGQARLMRRSRLPLSGPCASFLTALQAYYQFSPDHHVCEIGPARLHSAIVEARLPFRKYSTLDLPADPSALERLEKADLVIATGRTQLSPGLTAALKRLLEGGVNTPGFVALDIAETDEADGQIRRLFEECGVPRVNFDSIPADPGDSRRLFAFGERGGAGTPACEPLPMLAHIHVPKCAGTSFRILLESYFGPGHLRLYMNDTYFVYTEEALRNCLLPAPEARAFSSHHVRTYPRWLAGREMLYVAFLRDPIQQFVSYMTHIQKHYAGITSKSLLDVVPPDAPSLTLREFANWLLTHDRDIPFRENHNVNFFARHTAPGTPDRLEAAKSALAGFFFVGIAERMDESVSKLHALAQAVGLDFPPGPVPVENTSSEYRGDLSWIHPADAVGARLLRSVEEDQELYRWAVARLEEDAWPGYRPRNRLELSVGRA